MAISTTVKLKVNQILKRVNLKLEPLTAERAERRRLLALADQGYFETPQFPIEDLLRLDECERILAQSQQYQGRFKEFLCSSQNPVGYSYENGFFSSPDAEILYSMVRMNEPQCFVEIGSGYSTKVIRQAILDGNLPTKLISIDPSPRVEIKHLVDRFFLQPVESVNLKELKLSSKDILFIDSTHNIKTGGDVVFLFLKVLPHLPPGILIHIHDVFLPYEYPRDWVLDKAWSANEQYLLYGILRYSNAFEVVWPGYYLQKNWPTLREVFPQSQGRYAASFWIRKKP